MRKFLNIRNGIVGAVVLGALTFGAVSFAGGDQAQTVFNDQISSTRALSQLQQSQPTPFFKWSQERETLIDIEKAQANDTQTTSFGFNQGATAPVWSCPSIGVPIASDTQLTNPEQVFQDGWPQGGQDSAIPQVDPTGVYSGPSTGTYVLCVAPNGTTYIQYWEGFVDTVTGPAVWNTSTNSVQLTGPSTAKVTVKAGDHSTTLKKGKK